MMLWTWLKTIHAQLECPSQFAHWHVVGALGSTFWVLQPHTPEDDVLAIFGFSKLAGLPMFLHQDLDRVEHIHAAVDQRSCGLIEPQLCIKTLISLLRGVDE